MGAPGMASFCSNGHLCLHTIHHEIPTYEPKKCWCGSTEFLTQFEWGDPDYPQFVPAKWLYYGWRWSKKNNKMVKFFVYDISSLKKIKEDKKG